MKKEFFLIALGAIMMLTACEKIVIPEDEEASPIPTGELDGSAQLMISTRTGGGDNNAVAEGRIYIFNQAGSCVQMLSTDEDDNSAVAHLAAGSYSLYAVGGDDLSRFVLPTQNNATTTSVITRQEGKVMDDLLMKKADVVLEDGESTNLNMALEHKVLAISEVEIKKVPTDVTNVEVALMPLYSSIRLDGVYPDTPTESYKIALTKQDDGKTWKALPNQMLFLQGDTHHQNFLYDRRRYTRLLLYSFRRIACQSLCYNQWYVFGSTRCEYHWYIDFFRLG
ncbi:MAG: hypothetical protein IKN44_06360 [Bacteroidaceae bacterium]|nr:hypothetical protein [Bacteroidaceae bacterium]